MSPVFRYASAFIYFNFTILGAAPVSIINVVSSFNPIADAVIVGAPG
jgi:hypothetical protein